MARRAGDAVVTFGSDYRIRRANQAALALFGVHAAPGSTLQGLLDFAGLAPSSDRPNLPLRAIFQLRGRSSMMLLECLGLPNGRGALLRALVLPQAGLEWSLPSSQFLAVAAHEIRNPLAAIRALVQSLGSDPATSPDEADVAMTELDRLNLLLDDLLSLLHPKADAAHVFELDKVAKQAAAACQRLLQAKGQHLVLRLPASGAVAVRGSARRLEQVSLNLLSNASDAAPVGGAITMLVEQHDGEALLEVQDDGPGLSSEARAHFCEPFFTTKPQGTGLGLAICQRIAEQHGGRLEIPDDPGGARVRIYLPCD